MAAPKVLVVGAGVVGLRTSLELLKRNIPVILRAPVSPVDLSVCSQGAGGIWLPFHCDDKRTDRWALETLDELHTMLGKQEQAEQERSVELVHAVLLEHGRDGPKSSDSMPQWTKDPRLKFQHVTTEELWHQNATLQLRIPTRTTLLEHGYSHARFFQTPVVDSPKVLNSMLEEVRKHPLAEVDVETGVYYKSLNEMIDAAKALGCNRLLNATGLGAANICQDADLVGARGILLHYKRANLPRIHESEEAPDCPMKNDAAILCDCGPWGSDSLPSYIIPRGDIIVAGGSYLEGDMEASIRPEERKRLLQNARQLGIDTDKVEPIGQWTGYRPYRPISRLEVDKQHSGNDFRLVHSYGYGGSGWTVYVGCAKDAAVLLSCRTTACL